VSPRVDTSDSERQLREVELLKNSIDHLKGAHDKLEAIAKAAKARKEKALSGLHSNDQVAPETIQQADSSTESNPVIADAPAALTSTEATPNIPSLSPPIVVLESGASVIKEEFKSIVSK